ncbi:MAG TPA: PQQ-dependent sugar dehydrogenase, partial [Fibrobacteria bacterium]|nr:PQQ-dependent sugar dehydrogenase [Fibrobacteria bacterium]
VWAYGLRNPYKWAFDPVTGDLWAADVGQGTMEEVDIVEKGGNYGWNISEGTNKVSGDIKGPVWAYPRKDGGCIIGGYVFRGNPASRFFGQFIVGDYNSRNMWAVKSDGAVTALTTPSAEPRGWGTDNQGRLYLMAGTSNIYRLEGPDWNPAPVSLIPRDGNLKQAIGCIFSCRPGSRLADAAFAAGTELEILSLTGERQGVVHKASREVPASLKAGMYILRAQGVKGVKPNLLMVK